MLEFFPLIGWLPAAASVVMLAMLAAAGELRGRGGGFAVAGFVAAATCQYAGHSQNVVVLGLVLQVLLAIGLMLWWKMTA